MVNNTKTKADDAQMQLSLYARAAQRAARFAKLFNSGKAGVSVGKIHLPLHLTPRQLASADKNVAHTRMLHHMAMQESAGTNWQGQPRGFRIAPSSRKNPATHNPASLTRLEALAKAAGV
ncbi:hypothetical protein ACM25O_13250 [Sulfitobacter pontiacus]